MPRLVEKARATALNARSTEWATDAAGAGHHQDDI